MPSSYPNEPGYKRLGTSDEAALFAGKKAAPLREAIIKLLNGPFFAKGLTADEAAEQLNESILSIRPRFSELHAAKRIKESGIRRKNVSGRKAAVWVTVEKQRGMF